MHVMKALKRFLLLAHLWAIPFAASVGLLRGGTGTGQDLAAGAVEGGDPAWNNGTYAGHLAGDDVHHRTNHIATLREPRIIGGDKVTAPRYSYMVAFVDGRGLFCGGVLICLDMVLTAAHCTEKKENFEMFVGSNKLSDRFGSEGEVVTHSKKYVHPDYDWTTMEHDLLIYKLEKPVSVDVEVIAVNSDDGVPSSAGQRLVALGWGDTDKNPANYAGSDDLRRADVEYIPNPECSQREGNVGLEFVGYGGQVKDDMLCALGNGKDGCQGDSGGPLVDEGADDRGRQDALVGLSSWGVACAHETLPGVYARTAPAYPWIQSIVCANSAKPAAGFRCSRDESGSTSDGGGDTGGGGGGSGGNSMNKPAINNVPDKKPNKKPNKKPGKKPGKKDKPNGKKGPNGKKKPGKKNNGKKPAKKPGKKPAKKPKPNGKKPGKKGNKWDRFKRQGRRTSSPRLGLFQ